MTLALTATACPTWCVQHITGFLGEPGAALHRRVIGTTDAGAVVLEQYTAPDGDEPVMVRVDGVEFPIDALPGLAGLLATTHDVITNGVAGGRQGAPPAGADRAPMLATATFLDEGGSEPGRVCQPDRARPTTDPRSPL